MAAVTICSDFGAQENIPINPKGNQHWMFIARTDAEAEAPILWPPDAKNWLLRKDPYAGKDWRQEKRMTEDEMVGWHHWLYGHEFEQALGVGEGQGSLACCSPWSLKESDMTERLNNNNLWFKSEENRYSCPRMAECPAPRAYQLCVPYKMVGAKGKGISLPIFAWDSQWTARDRKANCWCL